MFKKEVVWMINHLKQLKNVAGGWRVPVGTDIQNLHLLSGELVRWLKVYEITTLDRYYQDDWNWETVGDSLEDCCSESS